MAGHPVTSDRTFVRKLGAWPGDFPVWRLENYPTQAKKKLGWGTFRMTGWATRLSGALHARRVSASPDGDKAGPASISVGLGLLHHMVEPGVYGVRATGVRCIGEREQMLRDRSLQDGSRLPNREDLVSDAELQGTIGERQRLTQQVVHLPIDPRVVVIHGKQLTCDLNFRGLFGSSVVAPIAIV